MDSLAARLSQATPTQVSGTWQRHVPSRHARAALDGRVAIGRWGTGDGFPVLYLGQPRDSVIVEAYRHLVDPVDDPAIVATIAPRVLVTATVAVTEILDLRTATTRALAELSMTQLQSPPRDRRAYAACQNVAAAAHQLGFHGLIAPAATGLGHTLALFTDCCRPTRNPPPSPKRRGCSCPPAPATPAEDSCGSSETSTERCRIGNRRPMSMREAGSSSVARGPDIPDRGGAAPVDRPVVVLFGHFMLLCFSPAAAGAGLGRVRMRHRGPRPRSRCAGFFPVRAEPLADVRGIGWSERVVLADPLSDLLVQRPEPPQDLESVLGEFAGPVVAGRDRGIEVLVQGDQVGVRAVVDSVVQLGQADALGAGELLASVDQSSRRLGDGVLVLRRG